LSAVLRALIAALVMQGCGPEPPPPSTPPPIEPLSVVTLGADALYLGVWGTGEASVWFVGGGPEGGVVAHYDGQRIFHEETPPGAKLWWIHGLDTSQIWAVGEAGRILRRQDGEWHEEETGLDEKAVLWGVWAAGPNDVWAVGGSYRRGGPKALVLHSTGDGRWQRIIDDAFPTMFNFYKIWGDAPNNIHLVGEGGVAVHWDGTRFHRQDTGISDLLFTVHGRASGPRLAVGGVASGLAFSFEEGKWLREPLPVNLGLNGVYVRSNGTAIACGERGILLTRDVDGRWSKVAQEALNTVSHQTLHAVWGDAILWAVGGDFSRGTDGVILTSTRSPIRVEIP